MLAGSGVGGAAAASTQIAWPADQGDGHAYEVWKQQREKEMEDERRRSEALADERWQAKEARGGKPRLWLPPEAVRMGPNGPEIRERETVYGRVSMDWAGILTGGAISSERLTECTLDLSDDQAVRVHAVAWEAPAAAAAGKHDCVIALVGDAGKRSDLQKVFGRVAFTRMTDADIDDLNYTMKAWAMRRKKRWTADAEANLRGHHKHVMEAEKATRKEERRVSALMKMLQKMGITETAIQKQLEATELEAITVKDEDGDVQMDQMDSDSASEEDTEVEKTEHNDTQTQHWQPPTQGTNESDPYLNPGLMTDDGNSIKMSLSYYDDTTDEEIRPMTHDEIARTWGGQARQAERTTGWKKGMGKEHDKPGEWAALVSIDSSVSTQPPRHRPDNDAPESDIPMGNAEENGDRNGDKGGKDDTRQRGPRRPAQGLQKPRQSSKPRYETRGYEARKQEAKKTTTKPPGGGQKK